MSWLLPVGGGARSPGGAECFQPVSLDGVASTRRFPRRHWRIRHTVFGPRTGTDRSQQGKLSLRPTNRANPAGRLKKTTKGVDRE